MNKLETILEQWERNKISFPLVCLGLAFISLLLFSQFTTPLTPYHGGDQSIFLVIGKGLTEGKIPYLDLYDHKGPVLFFIEALGWSISPGKSGIFIVQALFFALDIALVWKICRLVSRAVQTAFCALLFCSVFLGTIGGGNTCEEFSLTLNLAPLYLYLKVFSTNRQNQLSFRIAVLSGICLGLITFIRMNDAAIVAAIPLVLAGYLLHARNYKLLVQQGIGWCLGMVATVLAVVLFFVYAGAWEEFLEGTFLHNIRYAVNGMNVRTPGEQLALLFRLSFVLVGGIPLIALVKRKQITYVVASILCSAGVLAAISRWPGEGYMHYFTLTTPFLAISLALMFKAFHSTWVHLLTACILYAPFASSDFTAVAAFYHYTITDKETPVLQDVERLLKIIPESDRDSVWAFDVPPQIYTLSGITPCCPFFTMQHEHGRVVPRVESTINDTLDAGHPLWLITGNGCNEKKFKHLGDVMAADYEYVTTLSHLHVDIHKRKPKH